jgi:hypothetical protein
MEGTNDVRGLGGREDLGGGRLLTIWRVENEVVKFDVSFQNL